MTKIGDWARPLLGALVCVYLLGCGGDDGGAGNNPQNPFQQPTGTVPAPTDSTASGVTGQPTTGGDQPTTGTMPPATGGAAGAGGVMDPTPITGAAGSGGMDDPATDPTDTMPGDPAGMDGPVGMPTDADYAGYHDPGAGEWEMGTPEECKLDPSRVDGRGNLAVFRYGKLCHIQGGDTSGSNFSATKTLGGVLAGRAAYLVKDVPRTGPGTGPILHEDLATDWLGFVSYNSMARLTHVMSMTAFNANLAYGEKSFSYDTFGTREISSIVDVAMVALEQIDGVPTSAAQFMQQEVFDRLGMSRSSWGGGTIGTGWTGTLGDMGRVGVMLVHDGWYGGERFMEASWVYRMSHPAHEDANTSYGQLAWLNHRGNAAGIGGDIASGSNSAEGDPCAPAAFWPAYPHVGSEAPDCRATVGDMSCEQTHDVGVFSAQGLGGQFVVMHPGLDLVIVAHNFSNMGGPMGMWDAVRPAVVAMDPVYAGDEVGFCEAYGAGDYAPDLQVPRVAPTE